MTLDEFREQWQSPSLFIPAHTSGSTGQPKPVRLLKADMEASARATNTFFGLDAGSLLVCPLALDYIAGKMMAVRAWLLGAEPLMVAPSNRPDLPPLCSLLAVVPSQVPAVAQAIKAGKTVVENLLIGGAALPISTARMLAEELPQVAAYESYGMTETCSHVALRRVGGDGLFHAMPGVTFSIDSRGCLVIKAERLSEAVIVTNDMVRLADSGSFEWLGRIDNVINSGGIKLFAEQLEAEIAKALASSPFGNIDFYVTSEPDPKWGDRVVMVVEKDADGLSPDVQAMTDHMKAAMPSSHIPKHIVAVPSLARTASGKVRRILPAESAEF